MNIRPTGSVTHLLPAYIVAIWLSTSIDDGVGEHDKSDNSPLKNPTDLSMRLSFLSFDMMNDSQEEGSSNV